MHQVVGEISKHRTFSDKNIDFDFFSSSHWSACDGYIDLDFLFEQKDQITSL
jgi:hypothetical protein